MRFDKEHICETAMEYGFSHVGLAKIDTLKPMEAVRDMCAVDKCRSYNKTWTCPPGCGTLEECGERMQGYEWGILLQVTQELEDSMDYEGMQEGYQKLSAYCGELLADMKKEYKNILPLSSASCDLCRQCTYPDAPCRFPEKAVAAMEGYGLLVSQVCKDNDLAYYYGPDTVTYTGLFLVKE